MTKYLLLHASTRRSPSTFVQHKYYVTQANYIDPVERTPIGALSSGLCFHREDLVQSHKYHLRTYRCCFVGNVVIDWLTNHKHFESRSAVVQSLELLRQYDIIHHVCDDHDFKDGHLFYRFRRDDDTYKDNELLALFYKYIELNEGVTCRKEGIVQSFQQDGILYRNAFFGGNFVDYLLRERHTTNRGEAVSLGRQLLESNMIRHVTDDFHFRDEDELVYQFILEYDHTRKFSDLLHLMTKERRSVIRRASRSSDKDIEFYTPLATPNGTPESVRKSHNRNASWSHENFTTENTRIKYSDDERDRRRHRSDSGNCTDTSETSAVEQTTRSVLLRQATVKELESINTPYVKHSIKIRSDPVGYGFVIRGESPAYVQAVDPMGPAAFAGLKVRQYIHSVNGHYVLQEDHKTVGKMIMNSSSHLDLTVMVHKRDDAKLTSDY